ncbi:MAG: FHA domain-containing protein [Actinomycetota bacterium]|nr:FHA domain-containing protein [Actinomycetota bacterium]MDA2970910.1 FHA domain-containing protein [Actinomycetota bacterium]MDA3000104.1 FHA domain-containing protein [Actinomycetota bacterium]
MSGDSAACPSCGTSMADPERTQVLSRVAHEPVFGDGGTAVRTGTASLMVRSGPQAGERFSLQDPITRLGRHPDSDISLDDISVSRRHAEIRRDTDEYVLRDVGSLNGTYVNQRRVDSVVLQQGDEILIGRFRLLFIASSELA